MERKDLDERTQRVLAASFFGALPPDALDRLLASAVLVDVPAGGIVYRAEGSPRGALVVDGLIRVFITADDGRQMTVRYARAGEQLGAMTAVHGPVPLSAQAVTDTSLLMFSATLLRNLAQTDVRVAWPLAKEMAEAVGIAVDALAGAAFGSVRQRVARHLLDLATPGQRPPQLMTGVNQQAVADAVGTSREVVARTLRDFRDAGLVRTGRSGIVLLDPERMAAVITTDEV